MEKRNGAQPANSAAVNAVAKAAQTKPFAAVVAPLRPDAQSRVAELLMLFAMLLLLRGDHRLGHDQRHLIAVRDDFKDEFVGQFDARR